VGHWISGVQAGRRYGYRSHGLAFLPGEADKEQLLTVPVHLGHARPDSVGAGAYSGAEAEAAEAFTAQRFFVAA
jgi:hypothetical protein